MIDLSFLSQRMWDVYSLCSGVAKAGFNRMRDWENLSGVTFMDLMRNVDGTVKYAVSNPKEQLMQDYYAWKAVQPQRYLPESKGDTEENRAFLRRNFSGQLSVMDRIYALDTMREMGMITEEEMREIFAPCFGKVKRLEMISKFWYMEITNPKIDPSALAAALDFEFELPYPDGTTMGLSQRARAAFGKRLGAEIPKKEGKDSGD